ncbi:MAG: adenylosuccinate lyase [Nonlabens sp.]|uniref:adenylosuccinate lyase n=1 Tax=Nonlabens sp. TaxID=1888209 RepID=UPI003EF326C5
MNLTQLKSDLKNLKAYKAERVRLGVATVEYQLLPELIELCRPESGVSHQACWSLEQSFLLHEESCYPFLEEICALHELNINSSGMRSLLKMSSILSKKYYSKKPSTVQKLLTTSMRESMVEGCFEEFISTDKTANMAYAVYSLFEFGKEFDWIYPELQPILSQKLDEDYGNGFKSSARRIIAKLDSKF